MKKRWIYRGGEAVAEYDGDSLVWAKPEYYEVPKVEGTFFVPDIKPYQSMVDGSMITSRSQHRSHLKQHGMIEVGNETKGLTNSRGVSDVQIDRQSAERRKQMVGALVDKHRR